RRGRASAAPGARARSPGSGGSSRRGLLVDVPVGMYETGALDPLELVRAERVALRLREVLRQAGRRVTVEIGQAGGQRRHGDAARGRGADDAAPSGGGALQVR